MSATSNPVLTLSVKAAAALTANQFVTGAGEVAAPGGRALGVTRTAAAIGEYVAVDVIGKVVVIAADTLFSDELLQVSGAGTVQGRSLGVPVARRVGGVVATAGELIEVILIPN